MSTLALVISPTSDFQLGKGRKQTQPMTNAVKRPNPRDPAAVDGLVDLRHVAVAAQAVGDA
jgi:hypothetical protein